MGRSHLHSSGRTNRQWLSADRSSSLFLAGAQTSDGALTESPAEILLPGTGPRNDAEIAAAVQHAHEVQHAIVVALLTRRNRRVPKFLYKRFRYRTACC